MKTYRFLFFISCISTLLLFSCEDVENPDNNAQLNKIVLNINGKDTVMDISAIEIANYAKTYYFPARQGLSVISSQEGSGFHLDFYVMDTVLQVNKEYPVTPSVATTMYQTAVYYRNFNFDAYNTNTIVENETYYSKITLLEDTKIKGTFCFVYGNTILIKGTYYSDKLVRK